MVYGVKIVGLQKPSSIMETGATVTIIVEFFES